MLWVAASGMKNLTEPGPDLPLWSGDLAHTELRRSDVGVFHYHCASPRTMLSIVFNRVCSLSVRKHFKYKYSIS